MLCYRDKTYCDGAGCQKFNECPRAATREVIEASDRSGLMLARYSDPANLSCYVPPDGSEFESLASYNPAQRTALRAYLKAVEKSEKLAQKAADDFGMGRRRSTTNSANWSIYAGQRDRLEKALIETGVPLSRIIEIEDEWRKINKSKEP